MPRDPREQPVLIPPPSPESIDAAIDAANAGRLVARREGCAVALIPSPFDAEPYDRAQAVAQLEELIHAWGAERITLWVKNIAAILREGV